MQHNIPLLFIQIKHVVKQEALKAAKILLHSYTAQSMSVISMQVLVFHLNYTFL